ncbi:MAG: TonB family protein [Bacteroidales bacterium]|jgi:Ca-activated chloride channel family protein|nr:TonB family protein [Bacteroidales bacterium]
MKIDMIKTMIVCLWAGFMIFVTNSLKAQNMKDDKTLSPYFVVFSDRPDLDQLPLKATEVHASIAGNMVDVTVKQVYVNDGKRTIEALYTFPLSTKAAVHDMKMHVGTRTISAKIEKKEKARADYEQAKSEGKRASLLEQQRSNVFTMNVSNILPGDTISVELKYIELLVPEKGDYCFVYPTVVGPRYTQNSVAESSLNKIKQEIPYTHEGVLPTYRFDFSLDILSPVPIQRIQCLTHEMDISYPALVNAHVQLSPKEQNGGNRDLIISYSLQGKQIETGMSLYNHGDEQFFLLMVQPPKRVHPDEIPPREYIFIVDVSGSMYGFPLNVSKTLLRDLVLGLRPTDCFNVLLFSGNNQWLSEHSLPATPENENKALKFIDKQGGFGGTELMEALKQAYNLPRENPDLSRSFVIITDGYVTVEREAFQFIREHGNRSNVFCFGIGSAVNRYLIEGMAFMGNGEPMIVTQEDEAAQQAEQFRQYISTPVLTGIEVDWGKWQVYDVEPLSVPDLLSERPLVLMGKYKGVPAGNITLSGKTGQGKFKHTININTLKPDARNGALRYLWARERIKLLDYYTGTNARFLSRQDSDNIKKITDLGLKYNLMTSYTSFVAIDEQVVQKDGKTVIVKQPLPLPRGVSDYAIDQSIVNNVQYRTNAASKNKGSSFPVEEVEYVLEETKGTENISGQDNLPVRFVEYMPEPIGGMDSVNAFIDRVLKYPPQAMKENIEGTVVVEFVVEKDGQITNVKVLMSSDNVELDTEAVRVVKLLPKWKPAKHLGKPVRVYYQIPVKFRLK